MTDQIAGHENDGPKMTTGREMAGEKSTVQRNAKSILSLFSLKRSRLVCSFVSCYFIPAFSCPAHWSVNFTSVIFTSSIFSAPIENKQQPANPGLPGKWSCLKRLSVCVCRQAMNNNVVYPSGNFPGYSELPPPAAGPSAPPYRQSILHEDEKQTQPRQPPPPAWSNPPVNQYPPPPGPYGPYGQPMAPPYSQPPYGTPYYGTAPPPQPPPQQQQQVVMVNGGLSNPVIHRQPQTFIGQMILACFVLWCCNCPFGLVAFILAGKYTTNLFQLIFRCKHDI